MSKASEALVRLLGGFQCPSLAPHQLPHTRAAKSWLKLRAPLVALLSRVLSLLIFATDFVEFLPQDTAKALSSGISGSLLDTALSGI